MPFPAPSRSDVRQKDRERLLIRSRKCSETAWVLRFKASSRKPIPQMVFTADVGHLEGFQSYLSKGLGVIGGYPFFAVHG